MNMFENTAEKHHFRQPIASLLHIKIYKTLT